MNIRPIRNEEDYATAMARIDELWGAESGTAEGDELEVLALVVGKYEDERYPMPPSNPIEAIKFRMDQQGLTPRDLEPFIGSSGRVSEVLNGRRRLSLRMIVRLHEGPRIREPVGRGCLSGVGWIDQLYQAQGRRFDPVIRLQLL